MIVFSVISTKGGVGKTTLTASLGALLADFGLRVLLINADYQHSLNEYFHVSQWAPKGLVDVVTAGALLPDMISTVQLPPPSATGGKPRRLHPRGKLDLVYSRKESANELRMWLDNRMDYYMVLHRATHSPVVADQYDVILIDTQGATGKLQDAAAVAADKLIHPVCPDILTTREFLTATKDLIDRLTTVSPRTPSMYAVIYKQSNTKNAREMAAAIREQYINLRGIVTVVKTVVPVATAFERSATLKQPAHWLDAKASQIMHELAWELLPHIDGLHVNDLVEVDEQAASAEQPPVLHQEV